MSKITILCSNYNSKDWIDGYLKHLNDQLLEEFDIVFVDSASSDGSWETISRFNFRQGIKVKMIKVEEKISIAKAWNLAIKNSTTGYVINLNTDDRLYPSSLFVYQSYLESFPDVDVFYSPCIVVSNKEHTDIINVYNWPQHSHETMLQFCYCGPFPLLKKKSVEDCGLFAEDILYSFDYDMWLKMSYHGYNFMRIEQPLGTYFHNPIGNSTKPEHRAAARAEDVELQAKYVKKTKLSLLICSLNNRTEYLDRLMKVLNKQMMPEVEILVAKDNGEMSIGAKRNLLLKKSNGEYIAFIDDDDLVSEDYISLILKALESGPDVVGMHLLMTTDGKNECRTYHSKIYRDWWDEPDPDRPGLRRYFRNPNHLNPVKRSLAMQVQFPLISMGEDRAYSRALLEFLRTEIYIDKPIYFYEFRTNK